MKSGADLTEGSISKHLINLTLPMFLGISSMIVASMIDTVYVGWIGTLELAAISFTFPLIMGLTTVSMGIGVGASSIIARIVGSGHIDQVSRLSTDAMMLVAGLVVAVAGLMYVYQEPVFIALGAEADILVLAIQYMSIWSVGLPFFALTMVATMLMRAVGNARTPGVIMTGGSALQVVMAPILIFGLPGYWEGLGFPGAAWGFVVSRFIAFLYTIHVLNKMRLLDYSVPSASQLWASWREVLAIGIPSTMNNMIGPASMAITVALLAGHSHIIVAGFGVASRIESLAIMLLMALSASTGPFVGQNWGARRYQRIFEVHTIAYRFCLLYGVAIFVVLAGAGYPLVGLIIDDVEVVDATYVYLLIMPITYGLLGVGMIVGATFTALGKPMPALALSLGRMLIFYVPMALLGNALFGYQGIFGAAALANVIMGVLSVWWMKRYLKRLIPADER